MKVKVVIYIDKGQAFIRLPEGVFEKYGEDGITQFKIYKTSFQAKIDKKRKVMIPSEIFSAFNLHDKQEIILMIR